MKNYIKLIFILYSYSVYGQMIESKSYPGNTPGLILQGEAKPMKNLTLRMAILKPNEKSKKTKVKAGEYLILAKSGITSIISDKVSGELTPGSIAMITQGDRFRLFNPSSTEVSYYLMNYVAKDPMSGSDTASSFVRLWEDLSYRVHDRGGVRNYFNKRTSQSKRFEMHVTTLNAGLSSHDPHTHNAEEIVLIIDGNTEMLIGDKMYAAKTGELYFLGSNILHGIKNKGTKPATYFAYQWD